MEDYIKSSDYEDTDARHYGDGDDDGDETAIPEDEESWIWSDHDEDASEDEEDSWNGKIGMAIIINKAPVEGGAQVWDYTLRFNSTYGVSRYGDQVRDVRQET